MKFVSTRGKAPEITLDRALIAGLVSMFRNPFPFWMRRSSNRWRASL